MCGCGVEVSCVEWLAKYTSVQSSGYNKPIEKGCIGRLRYTLNGGGAAGMSHDAEQAQSCASGFHWSETGACPFILVK